MLSFPFSEDLIYVALSLCSLLPLCFTIGSPHSDPRHPDYCPSLKMGNSRSQTKEKALNELKRYERIIKREETKILRMETEAYDDNMMAEMVDECPVMEVDEPILDQVGNELFCGFISGSEIESWNEVRFNYQDLVPEKILIEQQRMTKHFNEWCVKLTKEKEVLEEKLQREKFSASNLKEKELKFYTGKVYTLYVLKFNCLSFISIWYFLCL